MGMRMTVLWVSIVALAGCTQLAQTGEKGTHLVRKTAYDTSNKLQSWTRYTPPLTTPQAPQSGYCYKTSSDVVCYENPQPHISNKLVAAQGDGSVLVESIPHDQMSAESAAAIPEVSTMQTPFYVKQAPYIRADGVEISSSKIVTQTGASGTRMMRAAGSTSDHITVNSGNPQTLMPRF